MKVLYIAVIDETGWGIAAQNYILALDSVGVDVAVRPFALGSPISYINHRVRELVEKPCSFPDVVIQHLLPHLMDYDGRVHNIGLYATETEDFSRGGWAERLSTMDELWVPNHQMVGAAHKSGVDKNIPIRVIPHACDIKRYERRYDANPYIKRLKDEGNFIFYTVGEWNRRKDFASLLKAFHITFSPEENVELVIKTSGGGVSPEELKSQVEHFSTGLLPALKLYANQSDYKKIHIITDRMTNSGLCSLHVSCDCFVQPSHGECWSLPAFDSMAFGKTPIVTDIGGYKEYVSDETGWLIKQRSEPVFGANDTFADQLSSLDSWAVVDLLDLRRCMREAYENGDLRRRKSEEGIRKSYEFDHFSVGTLAKKALYAKKSTTLDRY